MARFETIETSADPLLLFFSSAMVLKSSRLVSVGETRSQLDSQLDVQLYRQFFFKVCDRLHQNSKN